MKVDGVNEDVYNVLKKGERLYTDGENIPVGVIEDVRYEKMKYSVDVNEDGCVNVGDLAIIKANFGKNNN